MEPVAISWLVASATSPLIAVLALWTVYVFHTYRKRWRTVDLFLLAIASQELVAAVFTFGYAIVSLINPPIPALCSFIQWGMISARTFQISTLTSMVVDRGLTVRWPYRYRFSVRRNQIRYHIAVLALMSVLVGVAGVFAHQPQRTSPGMCSGHPGEWDFKFVVFSLGFYGLLMLLSLVCTVHIEVHKCRNGGGHEDKSRPFQLPDSPGPELTIPASVTSPLDNESHTGSTKALHRTYRHSSRRPYGKKSHSTNDFRWPPVAVVSLVCFCINHLPYVVLTSLATGMPWLWSPWHEAMLSWLRLGEGVLVPIILCLMDKPLRTALKRTFQRRSGALSPLVADDGLFQMYFDKDHFRKRGTFGSVTPVGIITNYRRTPGKKRNNRKGKYELPGLHSGDSIIEKSCLSGSFLSSEPLSKLSCADLTSLEVWQEEDEENFYATLSDDFSNFSANSTDDNVTNDEAKMCEDIYGGSFTTIANDDFEFHDTRPCGGEVRMKPAMPINVQPVSSFRSSVRSGSFFKEMPLKVELPKSTSTEKIADLMTLNSDHGQEEAHRLKYLEAQLDMEPDIIRTDDSSKSPGSLSKATSYSMNDLDLIHSRESIDKEELFILPVKSESTMSLYRLHMENGSNMGGFHNVTKSESNVNGDSGFASANHTLNPLWPVPSSRNYPCVLHPRMQKIPWISAWKKLEGNGYLKPSKNKADVPKGCDSGQAILLLNDNFQLRQKDDFQWKDSIVYAKDDISRRDTPFPKEALADFDRICEQTNPIYEQEKNIKERRHSRKNSFNESPKKYAENPYGRIKEIKMTDNVALADFNEPPVYQENIYEEIVSNKQKRIAPVDVATREQTIRDKSYAQSDITDLIDINTVDVFKQAPYGSCRVNEFKLNINVNPSLGVMEASPFNCAIALPVLPPPPPNISNLVVNCTPLNVYDINGMDRYSGNRKKFDQQKENCNNKLHVAYNVNDCALEFIDKSEESVFHEEFNDVPDFNANQVFPVEQYGEKCDLKMYDCRENSEMYWFDNPNVERKDMVMKRRESRNGRREDFSKLQNRSETKNINKMDPYGDLRREKNYSEPKTKDVRRRESNSRIKRESNLGRRESDHRSKKPRCASDGVQHMKSEPPRVQRKDSFHVTPWQTEQHPRNYDYPEMDDDGGNARTCIEIAQSVPKFNSNDNNYGELPRMKKSLYGGFQANGVIRLHCNYQDNNNCIQADNSVISYQPNSDFPTPRSNDINRVQLQNFVDYDDQRYPQRVEYVEFQRKDSARDRKVERPRKHELDRKESSGVRMKRRVSGSRERREANLDKKESFKDGSKHRVRRCDAVKGVKHVRRTNSFQTPTQVNNFDDMNRNESVKLNTESHVDEHARMDNLVYGRRDNGNFNEETEIFPFDTYVKPPSYNNVLRHNDRLNPNIRDKCKQKKIAITDYL